MTHHNPDEAEGGDDFYNAALDFLSIAAQHLPPEPDPPAKDTDQ